MGSLGPLLRHGVVLVAALAIWFTSVSREVRDVYLDEFFHVRQALVYYGGDFRTWDPKITTPPGLYLLSYPWLWLLKSVDLEGGPIDHLRLINTVIGTPGIYLVSYLILRFSKSKGLSKTGSSILKDGQSTSIAHVALNVALFPPLFFFSALYYTDVISTLLVLGAYASFLNGTIVAVILTSVAALIFRQTNIFWTAIWLGGLSVIRRLNSRSNSRNQRGNLSLKKSWEAGQLHDPVVEDADITDWIAWPFTLLKAWTYAWQDVAAAVWPYIGLLSAFVGFVIANEGVVLGDKSNHVASLHVPQMLYLWAYIVFFSFPVLLHSSLRSLSRVSAMSFPAMAFSAILLLAIIGVALAAVHFNTIIHPFTLADNRHYTFYIFRLLRIYPLLRYAAVPVYILCATFCFSAVSHRPISTVLIWLIAATGNLITAPLVEPRYFILAWVFWRLNAGSFEGMTTTNQNATRSKAPKSGISHQLNSLANKLERHSLWLETIWYLLINAITGYIFLTRKFEWPDHPGEVQRFMW